MSYLNVIYHYFNLLSHAFYSINQTHGRSSFLAFLLSPLELPGCHTSFLFISEVLYVWPFAPKFLCFWDLSLPHHSCRLDSSCAAHVFLLSISSFLIRNFHKSFVWSPNQRREGESEGRRENRRERKKGDEITENKEVDRGCLLHIHVLLLT